MRSCYLVLLASCLLALPAAAQVFVPADGGPITAPALRTYGASWADFDGDGDLDVFIANPYAGDHLIRNEGGGAFALHATFPVGHNTTGAVLADFDGDGRPDLVRTSLNSGVPRFYRNDGGTFVHVGTELDGYGEVRDGSAADYDGDGDLDLAFARKGGLANPLFLNGGSVGPDLFAFDGQLSTGNSSSVSWSDYDLDGDMDALLTNASGEADRLYRNDGGVLFLNEESIISTRQEHSAGMSWGDYDGDGDLDLFVATYDGPNRLYRNDIGRFSPVEADSVTMNVGDSHPSVWGDVDHDGDLDLVVADRFSGPALLFVNGGGGRFGVRPIETSNFGPEVSVTFADYDDDGDLDLLITRGNANEALPNRLYRNTTDGAGAWLQVELLGKAPNTSAVGARVRARATIEGEPRWQVREVTTRSGRMGQSALRVHFGLGDAAQVDSLEIVWPSGTRQLLTDLAADQILEVEEPGATSVQEEAAEQTFALTAYPNPSFGNTTVSVAAEAGEPLQVEVFDLLGRRVEELYRGVAPAGPLTLRWDGRDASGRAVSGVYVLRATAARHVQTVRLLLLP